MQYARAGASIAIVARSGDALGETRDLIVAAVPGADVLVLAADVRDVESVRVAVESVLERFGKLDILIANAGAISPFIPSENRFYIAPSLLRFAPFVCLKSNSSFHQSAEQKRSECVVEQFRGQYSWAFQFHQVSGAIAFFPSADPAQNKLPSSAAVSALEKTQGYIIIISSAGAQIRFPGSSDACISKLAVNRLVEFIVLGNSLNAFSPKIDDLKPILWTQSTQVSARSRSRRVNLLRA